MVGLCGGDDGDGTEICYTEVEVMVGVVMGDTSMHMVVVVLVMVAINNLEKQECAKLRVKE